MEKENQPSTVITFQGDEELQYYFIHQYLICHRNVFKAFQVTGISIQTYKRWCQDPDFLLKLEMARSSYIAPIREVAFNKAVGGDKDMIKYVLEAEDSSIYDAHVRAIEATRRSTPQPTTFGSNISVDQVKTITQDPIDVPPHPPEVVK